MIASAGIGRYTREVIRALREAEMQVTALVPYLPDSSSDLPEGVRRRVLAVPPYDPREQLALPFLVPPCDVFFSPHITTTALPVRARRRVVTIHDLYHLSDASPFSLQKKAYAGFLYANALRTADSVITVSRFTLLELHRLFPRYANKATVVPNSVDPGVFFPDPSPRRTERPFVLSVGNLKPHKNIGVAVRALELQQDPRLELVLAGATAGFRHGIGSDFEVLRGNPRLSFLGVQSDDALRRLYSSAECLVFPTRYEGFGYPPLEAMACGLPVVCSDIPVLRETCGEAAVFCEPSSAEAFAQAIENVRSDRELRARLIDAGFKRIERFTRARFREGTLGVVNDG